MALYSLHGPETDFDGLKDGHYKTGKPIDPPKRPKGEQAGHMMGVVKKIIKQTVTGGNDEKVALGSGDTAGYLPQKLVAGTGIQFNTIGPAGNQQIQVECTVTDTNDKVSLDGTDSPSYLLDKIQAGDNISFSIINDRLVINNDCCPDNSDELVKTSQSDECAGFLEDKIRSEAGGPIEIVRQNPSTCDEHLELQFDVSKAGFVDELVAAANGCTPGYLEDVLTVDTPFRIQTTGCTVKIGPEATDPTWKRPYAKLWYGASQLRSGLSTGTDHIFTFDQFNQQITNSPFMVSTPNTITIGQSGAYLVGIAGHIECSAGVNAVRVVLVSTNGANGVRLDQKYGAGNDTRDIVTIGSGYSIYDGVALLPFGQSNIIECTAGEELSLGLRVSTQLGAPNNVDANVRVLGDNGSIYTSPSFGGFSFFVHYIDNIL